MKSRQLRIPFAGRVLLLVLGLGTALLTLHAIRTGNIDASDHGFMIDITRSHDPAFFWVLVCIFWLINRTGHDDLMLRGALFLRLGKAEYKRHILWFGAGANDTCDDRQHSLAGSHGPGLCAISDPRPVRCFERRYWFSGILSCASSGCNPKCDPTSGQPLRRGNPLRDLLRRKRQSLAAARFTFRLELPPGSSAGSNGKRANIRRWLASF